MRVHSCPAKIFVRFKVPGFHCWPGAPDHRLYLRARHRHLFGFEVSTMVGADDREIEFHDLIDFARDCFDWPKNGASVEFGARSCEMIARQLAGALARCYQRSFVVTVDEDGECGATVEAIWIAQADEGPTL